MARKITDLTNTDPVSGNYPYGRVKDNPGDNTGTPVNEAMVGDALQFFNRLMALAAITPNTLPENSPNGFQLTQALAEAVVGKWEDASALLANGWVVSAGNVFEMRISGLSNEEDSLGDVEFRGAIENPDVFNNADILTVPVGFRPAYPTVCPVAGVNTTNFCSQFITIATSGAMQVALNVALQQTNNQPLYMNGVKFGRFAAP